MKRQHHCWTRAEDAEKPSTFVHLPAMTVPGMAMTRREWFIFMRPIAEAKTQKSS